jgi:hypothetical protein
LTHSPPPPPVPAHPAPRDWLGIWAVVSSASALLTCLPPLAALGGVLGFIAWRKSAAAGRRNRLAGWALGLAGAAIALQLALAEAVNGWLLPQLERRTIRAITAACEGRFEAAVPAGSTLTPVAPAPTRDAIERFAGELASTMGSLRSVSVIDPSVTGSPLTPLVTMALVARFEKGDCTGSAQVQWVAPEPSDPQPWLPAARVLEIDFSLRAGRSIRVSAPEAASP